jgi:hypothetical protein
MNIMSCALCHVHALIPDTYVVRRRKHIWVNRDMLHAWSRSSIYPHQMCTCRPFIIYCCPSRYDVDVIYQWGLVFVQHVGYSFYPLSTLSYRYMTTWMRWIPIVHSMHEDRSQGRRGKKKGRPEGLTRISAVRQCFHRLSSGHACTLHTAPLHASSTKLLLLKDS